MSVKNNPYNVNTQEDKFSAWAFGYEANNIEANPFGEEIEPELFRIFEQGYKANKNRAVKAPNLNAAASSTAANTSVTPQEFKQAINEGPGEVNLTLISLDKLLVEVSKRFKEYEEFKAKYSKVFG